MVLMKVVQWVLKLEVMMADLTVVMKVVQMAV